MLVHSFSAMVSCFTFLSEGDRCALGVAIVVGGSSGGFTPRFPERAFFPFLHFYKFGGLRFALSLFIFLSFPPPLLFFIFPLVCFARTAKGFAWTLPLRLLNLATCKRSIFAFSFLCFGTVVLSFESSSVGAIPFAPDVRVGSSARSPEPAEPCRSAWARFGATRPSGQRRFPPAACRIPPLPRRPGRRCPLRSAPKSHPGQPGIPPDTRGSALPVGGGTVAVLSPRNISKTLRGNYRFVWRLFRRFLVTKWQWVWIFQGFLGTRSVMSATVFISVLLRARGRILC